MVSTLDSEPCFDKEISSGDAGSIPAGTSQCVFFCRFDRPFFDGKMQPAEETETLLIHYF